MSKVKVISGIDEIFFSNGYMYITLLNHPLKLWFGPCDDNDFDLLCSQMRDYILWEWKYSPKNNRIKSAKIHKYSYIRC